MKKLIILLSAVVCVNVHSKEKRNMGQILLDKMERPPAISGRIVPTTLGKTRFFWYKLVPDKVPARPRVYNPGPVVNELIDNVRQARLRRPTDK